MHLYMHTHRVHVHASEIVIWGCWLQSAKEHDKCAKLVAGCSQTFAGGRGWRAGGLQRIGVGVEGGHVLLLSHVALGTVAGEWQAGEKNTTHRELWVWGLGEQDGCGAGAFSPGFIKGKKMKRRKRDLPPTIRVVAHSVFVCATERNAYLYLIHMYVLYIQYSKTNVTHIFNCSAVLFCCDFSIV